MSQHTIEHMKHELNWTGEVPIRWTKGLSAGELDKIMHAMNSKIWCGPVSARDDICNIKPCFVEHEPNASSTIFNTALKDQNGEHWVAIYYDPCCNDHRIEYFDSTGLMCFFPEIMCLIEYLSPHHAIVQNEYIIQNPTNLNSPACGFHCIYYLLKKEGILPPDNGYVDSEIMHADYPLEGEIKHINDMHAMLTVEKLIRDFKIPIKDD